MAFPGVPAAGKEFLVGWDRQSFWDAQLWIEDAAKKWAAEIPFP